MTVKELIEELKRFAPNDNVAGYEGEKTGVTIAGSTAYAFIETGMLALDPNIERKAAHKAQEAGGGPIVEVWKEGRY